MLGYDFMRHAFEAAAIVAVLAGIVGYLLVLRGQTFAGHALAHIGFTGATGAVLIGATPFAGMVVANVAAGVLMGALGERFSERDVAIGMVLAVALGFGLLFLHFYTAFASQATALLFGNILAVTPATIRLMAALAALSLALLGVIARPLLFASLQPELAEARGVRPTLYAMLFLAIAALATAEAAQVVGVLLVFTLLVGPAAAAQRLTVRLAAGIVLAALLALAEAWLGIVIAYYSDWPVSFCITALSGLVYALTLLPRPQRRSAAATA